MSDHSYTESEPLDPLLNTVIADRYHVEKRLGEGGMGAVYLARHIVLEKQVALKILHGEFSGRKDLVERFLHEAKAAARIRHEHVIDISDFGQTSTGNPFFCMEVLFGNDLAHDLREHGPPAWPRIKSIFLQTCSALQAAHEKNIIHRDLKPENIFLIERLGHPDFVKVLDFGIAKLTELEESGKRLTKTGMVFGTPEYMSPEQARGDKTDHRVDVYAMGCILYQLVTGDVPFRAETFMGVLTRHLFEPVPGLAPRPDTPPGLEAVVQRALDKDRDKRYATMNELAYAVDALDLVPGVQYYAPGSKNIARETGAQTPITTPPKTPAGVPSTSSAATRIGTPPPAAGTPPPAAGTPPPAAPSGAAATPTRALPGAAAGTPAPWHEGPVGAGSGPIATPGGAVGVATESVKSFEEPRRARGGKTWLWVALGLALVGGGAGAAVALSGGKSEPAPPAVDPVAVPTLTEAPDAAAPVVVAAPPDAGVAVAVPPPDDRAGKRDPREATRPGKRDPKDPRNPKDSSDVTKPGDTRVTPPGDTTRPPPGDATKPPREIKDPFNTGGAAAPP